MITNSQFRTRDLVLLHVIDNNACKGVNGNRDTKSQIKSNIVKSRVILQFCSILAAIQSKYVSTVRNEQPEK